MAVMLEGRNILHDNRFHFPEERTFIGYPLQYDCRDYENPLLRAVEEWPRLPFEIL